MCVWIVRDNYFAAKTYPNLPDPSLAPILNCSISSFPEVLDWLVFLEEDDLVERDSLRLFFFMKIMS